MYVKPFRPALAVPFVLACLLQACGGGSGDSSSNETVTPTESIAAITTASGWAAQSPDPSNTSAVLPPTGGEGAPATNIYVATSRAELRDALLNKGSATYATNPAAALLEPKIVYIKGTIYGTDLGNGKFATEDTYKAANSTCGKWDFDLYVKSFDSAYMADLQAQTTSTDATVAANATATLAKVKAQGSARTNCANVQKAQIQFAVPSNTTILGVGTDAKIIDGYLELNARTNVIVRNLEIQAVQDRFPGWTPSDGPTGNWNSRYKGIAVVTGTRLWFDHLTLSDGSHPDSQEPVIYGKHVQRHDGLLDMEDGTDYVTVSYSIFKNHDKTIMIGSGDGKGSRDRGKNHMTFFGNLFDNSQERSPRVRFGQVHIYNNYFRGSVDDVDYPMASRALNGGHYFIGMGIESMILSEANAFEYKGTGADENVIIDNFKGYQFKDNGSWFNDLPLASATINAVAKARYDGVKATAVAAAQSGGTAVEDWATHEFTNELGWTPPYTYTLAKTAAGLKAHVLANAGAGKMTVKAP